MQRTLCMPPSIIRDTATFITPKVLLALLRCFRESCEFHLYFCALSRGTLDLWESQERGGDYFIYAAAASNV